MFNQSPSATRKVQGVAQSHPNFLAKMFTIWKFVPLEMVPHLPAHPTDMKQAAFKLKFEENLPSLSFKAACQPGGFAHVFEQVPAHAHFTHFQKVLSVSDFGAKI